MAQHSITHAWYLYIPDILSNSSNLSMTLSRLSSIYTFTEEFSSLVPSGRKGGRGWGFSYIYNNITSLTVFVSVLVPSAEFPNCRVIRRLQPFLEHLQQLNELQQLRQHFLIALPHVCGQFLHSLQENMKRSIMKERV